MLHPSLIMVHTIISPPADNVVDSDIDDLCSEELVAMDEVRISPPERNVPFHIHSCFVKRTCHRIGRGNLREFHQG